MTKFVSTSYYDKLELDERNACKSGLKKDFKCFFDMVDYFYDNFNDISSDEIIFYTVDFIMNIKYDLQVYIDYLINKYKTLLHDERLTNIKNEAKAVYQLSNYILQNYMSKNIKYNTLVPINETIYPVYRPWDFLLYDEYILIIDSEIDNNLKIFNFENNLIKSMKLFAPTKILSINNKIITHSTYMNIISVIDINTFEQNNFTVPDKISLIYYSDEKYHLLTYQMELYETVDFIDFCYIKTIKYDFFIDSYVEYKNCIYCISFTDNRVLVFNKENMAYKSTIVLYDNYMPNSIEVCEDKIFIVDKETGFIYQYDLDGKLYLKDGFFSNKKKFGIADPIGISKYNDSLYVLNWLKNSIIKYKVKNEKN